MSFIANFFKRFFTQSTLDSDSIFDDPLELRYSVDDSYSADSHHDDSSDVNSVVDVISPPHHELLQELLQEFFSCTENSFKFCLETSLRYAFFKDKKDSLIKGDTFSSFFQQVILKSDSVHTQFMFYQFSDKIRRTCVYFVLDYVYLSDILQSMGIPHHRRYGNDVVLFPGLLGIVTIFNDGRYTDIIFESFSELNQYNKREQKFRWISNYRVRYYFGKDDLSLPHTMLSQSLHNSYVFYRTIPFNNVPIGDFFDFVNITPVVSDSPIIHHHSNIVSIVHHVEPLVDSIVHPVHPIVTSPVSSSPVSSSHVSSSPVSSSLDVMPLNADHFVDFCGSDGFVVYYCLKNLKGETIKNYREIVFTFITRDEQSIEYFITSSSLVGDELLNLRNCLLQNNGDNLEYFLENPSFNKDLLLDISQSKAFHEHCFKRLSIDSLNDFIKVFHGFIGIIPDSSDILPIDNNAHHNQVSSVSKTRTQSCTKKKHTGKSLEGFKKRNAKK
jgi:hypothetical protein